MKERKKNRKEEKRERESSGTGEERDLEEGEKKI